MIGLEIDQHTRDPGGLKLLQGLLGQLGRQLDEGVVGLDGDVAEVAAVQDESFAAIARSLKAGISAVE